MTCASHSRSRGSTRWQHVKIASSAVRRPSVWSSSMHEATMPLRYLSCASITSSMLWACMRATRWAHLHGRAPELRILPSFKIHRNVDGLVSQQATRGSARRQCLPREMTMHPR